MYQFNDYAVYGSEVDFSMTGREANDIYAKVVIKGLLSHGSYPYYVGKALGTIIGTSSDSKDYFDQVAVVRYRSRRDMLEIFQSPEEVGLEHKFAGIYETVVVCTAPTIFLSDIFIGIILVFILVLV